MLVDLVELLVCNFALAGELRAQTRDRIVESIFFQLIFRPITCRVGHGMPAISISANLDERRMRIFANGTHDLGKFVAHFAEVHSIDNLARNVVTLGAINDLFQRCRSFHRSAHGEEIIFADENDRQFIKRDEIERFVK